MTESTWEEDEMDIDVGLGDPEFGDKEFDEAEAAPEAAAAEEIELEDEPTEGLDSEEIPRIDGNDDDMPTSSMADVENFTSKTTQFAHNLVNNFPTGESTRELSFEDFDSYSEGQLQMFDDYPGFEDTVFESVLEKLKASRVSLLVGPKGLGKGGCVKTVAGRLLSWARKFPADSKRGRVEEVLMASTAMREIRVPLLSLVKRNKRFHRRVLVLEDAFDDNNRDLVSLLGRLDGALLNSVAETMKKIESYLVLTTAPEQLPKEIDKLQALGIVTRLEPPPSSVLLKVLHRRATDLDCVWATSDDDLDWPEALEATLEQGGEIIVEKLGSAPRVLRFVDSYLVRVVTGELTLLEALERVDDLTHWLLQELPVEDEDTWTFVLALILCSTDSSAGWVPWIPLQRMWQVIAETLGRALGRDPEESSRPVASLVVDQRFLSRAQVSVRRLPFPIGECVRFEEPQHSSRLWEVLLREGRRIFTLLIEPLRSLAEGADPRVRRLASQALGRAGELDPRELFYRQVHVWSGAQDDRYLWSLGGLELRSNVVYGVGDQAAFLCSSSVTFSARTPSTNRTSRMTSARSL